MLRHGVRPPRITLSMSNEKQFNAQPSQTLDRMESLHADQCRYWREDWPEKLSEQEARQTSDGDVAIAVLHTYMDEATYRAEITQCSTVNMGGLIPMLQTLGPLHLETLNRVLFALTDEIEYRSGDADQASQALEATRDLVRHSGDTSVTLTQPSQTSWDR